MQLALYVHTDSGGIFIVWDSLRLAPIIDTY